MAWCAQAHDRALASLVAKRLRGRYLLEDCPREIYAAAALPASVLERFEAPDLPSKLAALLRFLTPLAE